MDNVNVKNRENETAQADTMLAYYKSLCYDCNNAGCAYNATGECRFAMVFHRLPVMGAGVCQDFTPMRSTVTGVRADDLAFIQAFADGMEGGFSQETECAQLKALWTAYCLRHNLDVDTGSHDSDLRGVWAVVDTVDNDNCIIAAKWHSNFESFYAYMIEDLV